MLLRMPNRSALFPYTTLFRSGQSAAYIIQKQAEADGIQRVAEGEASGIRAKLGAEASGIQAKLTAEAEGTRALLDAKAQGFEKLLKVADDTSGATQLLIAENIVRIAEVQAGAMKGLQFEKVIRSEEHTSELQSRLHLVCRLLLEKKK